MVILLIYKPNYTFPGLAIVILGIPVFSCGKNLTGTGMNSKIGSGFVIVSFWR